MAEGQLIEVGLIKATNLKDVNYLSKMETYAVMSLNPYVEYTTQVDYKGNVNPNWNEKLGFMVPESALQKQDDKIKVEIYTLSTLGPKFVCEASIPLSDFASLSRLNDPIFKRYPLKTNSGDYHGDLHVSLSLGKKMLMKSGSPSYPIVAAPHSSTPPSRPPPPSAFGDDAYYTPSKPPTKPSKSQSISEYADPYHRKPALTPPPSSLETPPPSSATSPYSKPMKPIPQPSPPAYITKPISEYTDPYYRKPASTPPPSSFETPLPSSFNPPYSKPMKPVPQPSPPTFVNKPQEYETHSWPPPSLTPSMIQQTKPPFDEDRHGYGGSYDQNGHGYGGSYGQSGQGYGGSYDQNGQGYGGSYGQSGQGYGGSYGQSGQGYEDSYSHKVPNNSNHLFGSPLGKILLS